MYKQKQSQPRKLKQRGEGVQQGNNTVSNGVESSALKQNKKKYNKILTHINRYIEDILYTGRNVQLTNILFNSVDRYTLAIMEMCNSNSLTQPENTDVRNMTHALYERTQLSYPNDME